MSSELNGKEAMSAGKRRRWLLALDPIFEGGRRDKRARAWDVEDELVAVALFGDVTIDLSQTRSAPAEIEINAYAIFRDVDVLVSASTQADLFGGVLRGELSNEVPGEPDQPHDQHVRIHGHSLFGDVTVQLAPTQQVNTGNPSTR